MERPRNEPSGPLTLAEITRQDRAFQRLNLPRRHKVPPHTPANLFLILWDLIKPFFKQRGKPRQYEVRK